MPDRLLERDPPLPDVVRRLRQKGIFGVHAQLHFADPGRPGSGVYDQFLFIHCGIGGMSGKVTRLLLNGHLRRG